jgi:hypothetical protein
MKILLQNLMGPGSAKTISKVNHPSKTLTRGLISHSLERQELEG